MEPEEDPAYLQMEPSIEMLRKHIKFIEDHNESPDEQELVSNLKQVANAYEQRQLRLQYHQQKTRQVARDIEELRKMLQDLTRQVEFLDSIHHSQDQPYDRSANTSAKDSSSREGRETGEVKTFGKLLPLYIHGNPIYEIKDRYSVQLIDGNFYMFDGQIKRFIFRPEDGGYFESDPTCWGKVIRPRH